MSEQKIGLKDAIQAAYEELIAAMTEIPVQSGLNFLYKTIDLEFTVEVTHSAEAKAGVRFWVLEAGGDASQQRTRTHVVKLSIEPQGYAGRPATITGSRTGSRVMPP